MLTRLRSGQDDEGFTLIELLVVIIIIGILAAIAIPVFLNQRQKGYDAAAKSDLRNVAGFEEIYLSDFATYGTLPQVNVAEPKVAISKNVTVSLLFYSGATGYCLKSVSSQSGRSFYYDSRGGGLQPTGATGCSVTTSGMTDGGQLP